ncbi:hypothetical protein, partial [Pseudomonas yangonensis]|uniref:hypothetical protein n=1 Tax=Pseudomonas yangonensis TaxID=2579922 RepID=UPI001C49A8BC
NPLPASRQKKFSLALLLISKRKPQPVGCEEDELPPHCLPATHLSYLFTMLVRASSPGSTWAKLAKGGGWQGLAFSLLSNIEIRRLKNFLTPPTHKSRRTVAKEGRKNPRKTHETLAALRLQPFHPSDKEKPKSDRRTVRFSPKNRGSFVQQQARFWPIGVQKSHGSQLVYFVYYIDFFYRNVFTDSLSLASLPTTRLPLRGHGALGPSDFKLL